MQQTSLSLLETCKKFSEMFCPLKLGCPGRSQEGSLLISAVVILLVVSVFALIALSLTASGQFQSASTTMSLQAFYTAESGLRYAAVKYLQQENTGGLVDENDKSADDEKALYIENLDGMTIDLQEGRGSLSFQVFG